MKLEWDPDKERLNIQNHKVSFVDAGHVFADLWQLMMMHIQMMKNAGLSSA